MATTFNFYKLNKFPVADAEGQVILELGNPAFKGVPAKTRMIFKKKGVYNKFERYSVYHEYLRHAMGRTYEGLDFEEFYEKNEFEAFVDRENNHLICKFKKEIAKDFVDTLNEDRPGDFNADYLKIDFAIVKPRMQEIRGVWFNSLATPFLQSAGFFGLNVDKSDMCKQATAMGKASSFLVNYSAYDLIYPLIISAHYGVTFLQGNGEDVYFSVLEHMQKELFQNAVSPELSRFNIKQLRKEEAVKQRSLKKLSAASAGNPQLPFEGLSG